MLRTFSKVYAMAGLRAPWGAEGGVEQSVGELAPRLVERGVQVTVYCRGRYNPHGPGFRAGVRLVDTPTVYTRSLEALVHDGLAAEGADIEVIDARSIEKLRSDFIPLRGVRKLRRKMHGLSQTRGRAAPLRRDRWGTGGRDGGAITAPTSDFRAYSSSE